ncbi:MULTISPECIES: hypothetical protein [unclassified Chelatococcus]|uniref:hypothetical protein n=1 Tax=unclassified Chelatococcus TaxID=2638111 RepID=UPI001BD0C492|nr:MULTISPECIES: hypothetical protein [unclassified Chelatococcus]MBS7743089.1 hypothetical protein [Chelatococcus sp. HY11]MBX3541793.1 hypothetical protein [Chelatococcus sp.]MCO5074315.1 hypothetical protein [Chelatococcus sp.]
MKLLASMTPIGTMTSASIATRRTTAKALNKRVDDAAALPVEADTRDIDTPN